MTGLADDNSVGPFPIGFMFEYYGTLYNSFMICSNGSIRLGAAAWGNSVLAPFSGYSNRWWCECLYSTFRNRPDI
ncbi:MAG: hypothetical protein IPK10_07680 [Bacteroidetes bacterium]|nr:hypothetical protein [Bacteroidota bacterium]